MALLTTQTVDYDGLVPSTVSATATTGDTIVCEDHVFAMVVNGSGGSITAAVATTGNVEGFALADASATVGAGATAFIGPLKASLFANSSGLATVICSSVTSVTIAAVRC